MHNVVRCSSVARQKRCVQPSVELVKAGIQRAWNINLNNDPGAASEAINSDMQRTNRHWLLRLIDDCQLSPVSILHSALIRRRRRRRSPPDFCRRRDEVISCGPSDN